MREGEIEDMKESSKILEKTAVLSRCIILGQDPETSLSRALEKGRCLVIWEKVDMEGRSNFLRILLERDALNFAGLGPEVEIKTETNMLRLTQSGDSGRHIE